MEHELALSILRVGGVGRGTQLEKEILVLKTLTIARDCFLVSFFQTLYLCMAKWFSLNVSIFIHVKYL